MQVVREHRDDLVSRVRVLTVVVIRPAGGHRHRLLVRPARPGRLLPRAGREQPAAQAADQGAPRPDLRPQRAPAGRERPELQPDARPQPAATNLAHSLWLRRRRPRPAGRRPPGDPRPLPRRSPSFKPVLLAENLTLSQVARFGVAGLEYPEFEVEVQHLRLYRHREQTAHVLGYLGEVTQEEIARLERRLSAGRPGGQEGDRADLRHRSCAARTASGWWWSTAAASCCEEYGGRPPVPGKNLTLTIDLDLQQEAARWLEGPEKVGAVVAMDPQERRDPGPGLLPLLQPEPVRPAAPDGRLAGPDRGPPPPAAEPGDPEHLLAGLDLQDRSWRRPGLTEGVFDEHTTVFCAGARSFYGRRFRCWQAGRARHGRRSTGAQALLRRLLLHPRPEAGDRADRPLRPDVRPRARPPASTSRARSAGWCRTRRGARRCASSPGTRARPSRSRSARGRCS